MGEPASALPDKIRWVLDNLPFIYSRSFIVVYDPEGTIVYFPPGKATLFDYELGLLAKYKKITDLIRPPYGSGETRLPLESFLQEQPFLQRVTFLTREQLEKQGPVYREGFLYGVPAVMMVRKIEAFHVAMVYPLSFFKEYALGAISEDMLALLGPDNEIVMFTDLFYRILHSDDDRSEKLYMENLTDSDKWFDLLHRDSRVIALLEKKDREAEAAAWTMEREWPRFDPDRWIQGPAGSWAFGGESMRAVHAQPYNVFNTSLEIIEHSERDVRIEFTADLSSFPTAGACFFTNVYKCQSFIGSVDSDGYNFQLLLIADDWVEARLKKFNQVIASHRLSRQALETALGPRISRARLAFQKSSLGVFRLFLEGNLLCTLYDTAPLTRSKNQFFSLIGGQGACYRDLKVMARPSSVDPDRIPLESVDLKFHYLPDRVFETRIGVTAGQTYFAGLKYVYMKDVTYSRELLYKINRYVREIDEDLNTAKRIQAYLTRIKLPESPRIRFSYFYRPSGKVGGDMLDIKEVGRGRYALLIYDVAGHGIAASLVSAMAKMSFDNLFKRTTSPGDILNLANRDICAVTDPSMFLTAFLCIVDLNANTLTYSRAGHSIPAILSKRRPSPLLLDKGGPVIGNSPLFNFEEYKVLIQPGDRILLYTDGFIEVRNRAEEFFERRRLVDVVKSTLGQPLDRAQAAAYEAVSAFCGHENFEDDMAMILADIL